MALTKPFAEKGEKKAISLTPDAEGTMNYQDGFGQRYSLPVKSTISEDGTITTTGGLWIQREQFNQLMFDTTSAIIENQDNITQLNQDLGNKGDLTTTNKDNIVSAINEIDSNIGDLQDLTTTEKSNVVSAVNEIDSNYVRLDTEQTIPSVKTFSNVVNFGSIVNVNGEANFNDNVEMVNTPTITSPKTFQDLIDNELITKAQSVSKFVDFDTNQSVTGLKTFTALPQSEATPTDDKDLTTKLYVDTTLSDKIAEIGKAMGFKGIVENATDLPTDTATDGDMYYNKASSGETEDNKKGFYVFNGTAFDFIGATISMDFDKIFEIEEKQGDLTQLKTTAKDSLVNAINENYDSIATNSNNIGTLGNLTTTAKDNLVDSINEIDNNLKNNNFVTLDTNQTITSLKTFDTLPQSSVTPANDTDLVTKAYVDNIQVDTSNLAKLDKANTFTESNTFTGEVTLSTIVNTPTITNPTEWASMGDNEIPTKKQIQDNIQGGGGGNYLPLNIDTDTVVRVAHGSNAQLTFSFSDANITQGATFEISNQENNIQFAKDAGINNIKLNQNLEFKLDSNINADVIFSDDYTKQKFQNALGIGGGGSGGVTLNTEQTITGNKFFQADENANQFVRFYPTPTQIEGGSSNYVAHMGGYVLIGKDDSMHPNNSLIIDIPTQRTLYFTNTSGSRRGSVAFEDSSSLQGFNVSYNSKLLGSSYNTLEGSFFNDTAWAGSGSYLGNSCIGVGHITDGNDECGAFIATPYNLYITLADSTSELVLNDKAKSEFQRVLEIPSTSTNNTWTGTQTFNNITMVNGGSIYKNIQNTLFIDGGRGTSITGENVSIYSENGIVSIGANLSNSVTNIGVACETLNIGGSTSTKNLNIGVSYNGNLNITLDSRGTLTMDARAISEFKRVLGIS